MPKRDGKKEHSEKYSAFLSASDDTLSCNELNMTWLSWSANRPCILLTFRGLRILLDCAIGMDSLATFLPCSTVKSNRISWQKKVHPYGKTAIPVLKQINNLVYVELLPEMRTIMLDKLDLATLDVILISNTSSLTALPFFTEGTDFKGAVYATDPIIQLGKLIMEDLCDMFERVDRPSVDEWAWKCISNSFPNPPTSDPCCWHQLYTRDEMERSLARIQRVFYREEIVLADEFRITPFSSGYAIGACNWLLCTNEHKIGYLAASSLRHSHSKPMELSAFTHLDSLILTSMSNIDQSPDVMVYKFTSAVMDTLKIGGNVLIPVVPTGLVYDLFEYLLKAIEVNDLSRNIPVYFISSVAENTLEFANIFSEWLCDEKGARVYKPEEPFFHSELVRNGRIRVFDSLHGPFSRECRQPCIVFTGHPSLRVGEVVHLLDFWGGNSRNAIMMIDSDYPLETYYSPYKTLAIRAYYFPIETRLDCTQVLNKIINELAPTNVLYPEEYKSTLSGTLSALGMSNTMFWQNEQVELTNLGCDEELERQIIPKKRVRIDAEVLKRTKPSAVKRGLLPIYRLYSIQQPNDPDLLSITDGERKSTAEPTANVALKFTGRYIRMNGLTMPGGRISPSFTQPTTHK